jgi:hypothetical protein
MSISPRGSTQLLALLVSLLAAGCAGNPQHGVQSAGTPRVCRMAPDGSAVAERGIGGTGSPSQIAERGIGGTGSPAQMAERGIGGTGSPSQIAERGIGGTGIVGVITGFASICVDGLEVAYDANVPTAIDGQATDVGDLRGGQLVVVEATGATTELKASRISVRHEVSGPVQRASDDGKELLVAGQVVRITDATLIEAVGIKAGDWIAVSGLRDPSNQVVATRIDKRQPGLVTVHGSLDVAGTIVKVGGLPVKLDVPVLGFSGSVEISGRFAGGMLIPDRIEQDPLGKDPARLFGPQVDRLFIESATPTAARAVTEMKRLPTGGFGVSGQRPSTGTMEKQNPASPGRSLNDRGHWEAAPVPNRSVYESPRAGAGQTGRQSPRGRDNDSSFQGPRPDMQGPRGGFGGPGGP